jgi:glycosyltransferase involved in cell wall biosynthesis
MRILHLVHSLESANGGVARAVEWLADGCAASGWDTQVIASHADPGAGDRDWRLTLHPPRSRVDARLGPRALRDWWSGAAGSFDLVVAHGLWQFPTALPALARPRSLAVVPHGMLDPWFRRAQPVRHLAKQMLWWGREGGVLNGADRIIFTAREEQERAQGVFRPYRLRPAVCPLGIADPAGEVPPESAPPGWPDAPAGPFLLFLARLHPKKGADLLIEAWARLGTAVASVSLVIAGPEEDSRHAAELRNLADKARLAGAGPVLFPGMVRGQAKWWLLSRARALVLPSHQDNFGMTVIEALAVGTPVLLSREVAIWREVEESDCGQADADTAEGCIRLLRAHLAATPVRLAEQRRAARRCFETRFLASAALEGWLETLRQAAAGKSGDARPESAGGGCDAGATAGGGTGRSSHADPEGDGGGDSGGDGGGD